MATRFWVGGAGAADGTTTTQWASTSGGAGGASYPTSSDDVVFDANSGTGVLTISVSQAWRSLTSVGTTLTQYKHNTSVTLSLGSSTSNGTVCDLSGFGTFNFASSTTSILAFVGTSGTQETVKTGNQQVGTTTFNGAGGSWILGDNLTTPNGSTVTLTTGALDLGAGHAHSWGTFVSTGVATRSLALNSSTVSLTATTAATVWNTSASLSLTAGTSTIAITDTGSNAKTFAGSGLTYNNLTITAGGTGAIKITGANTFNVVTVNAPKTVTWPSSTTNHLNNLISNGASGSVITHNASTAGTRTTWTAGATVGGISQNWSSYQDINAVGASWWAGANGTNVSNNAGITFTTPTASVSVSQTETVAETAGFRYVRTVSPSQTTTISRGHSTIGAKRSVSQTETVAPASARSQTLQVTSGAQLYPRPGLFPSPGLYPTDTFATTVQVLALKGATASVFQTTPTTITRRRQVARVVSVSQATTYTFTGRAVRHFSVSQATTVTAQAGSARFRTVTLTQAATAGVGSVKRSGQTLTLTAVSPSVVATTVAVSRHVAAGQPQTIGLQFSRPRVMSVPQSSTVSTKVVRLAQASVTQTTATRVIVTVPRRLGLIAPVAVTRQAVVAISRAMSQTQTTGSTIIRSRLRLIAVTQPASPLITSTAIVGGGGTLSITQPQTLSAIPGQSPNVSVTARAQTLTTATAGYASSLPVTATSTVTAAGLTTGQYPTQPGIVDPTQDLVYA